MALARSIGSSVKSRTYVKRPSETALTASAAASAHLGASWHIQSCTPFTRRRHFRPLPVAARHFTFCSPDGLLYAAVVLICTHVVRNCDTLWWLRRGYESNVMVITRDDSAVCLSICLFVCLSAAWFNKKDGYRQQNVRQRQKLISIIDYDVCMTFY